MKAINGFRQCFRDALKATGFNIDTAGPADLIVNPPGMRTTAYNYEHDRPMGLHIDNHQAFPLNRRETHSFLQVSILDGNRDIFISYRLQY